MHTNSFVSALGRRTAALALGVAFAANLAGAAGAAPRSARGHQHVAHTRIIFNSNASLNHRLFARNAVIGRTNDGGRVYGDGRILYRNGHRLRATNDGSSPCTFDGFGVPCDQTPYGYDPNNPDEYNATADNQCSSENADENDGDNNNDEDNNNNDNNNDENDCGD